MPMRELLPHAERVAALLKERKETVAVAESSAGGLITAALLGVPGASAYCLVRERFAADWGIGETGAAGPAGNRYGDPAGHACLAVSGRSERAITLQTGSSDRIGNMYAFAAAALDLLAESL